MKLLIIKTSSLGDIVHAREALAVIPSDIQVDWVVEKPFKELLEGHVQTTYLVDTKKWRRNPLKWIGEITAFIRTLRKEHYDVIVDLQGNFKASLILACCKGNKKVGFGWKSVPEKVNLFFTRTRLNPPAGQNIRNDYLFLLKQALGFTGEISYPMKSGLYRDVLVCPGSAWKNKQLPLDDLLHFLQSFQKDHESVCFHFLWGNASEKGMAERLQTYFLNSHLIPKLSLAELEAKMKKMDFVIAMDSFPLHLAGSLGIPTMAFFGPSSANKYNPLGPQARYIQGICPYGRTFNKRCPVLRTCPTGACMKSLK